MESVILDGYLYCMNLLAQRGRIWCYEAGRADSAYNKMHLSTYEHHAVGCLSA